MNEVFISFKDWCRAHPIKKVTERPNCEKEDGPFLFRVDAETHARLLAGMDNKSFQTVEYEDEYYVIEAKNG